MKRARVLVVMSTYNGERYLEDQIDSILNQKGVDLDLYIRDDGSTDGTGKIVNVYANKYSRVKCELSTNIGFAKSFFSALKSVEEEYDYYAFADQDDVWDCDKLSEAVLKLENSEATLKMYASGLKIVDENLKFQYNHNFGSIRIKYGSALSRQRLAGCTMVFNKALKDMVCKFELGENKEGYFSHDTLVYYVCLLCGGTVVFNPNGKIWYRRHADTVTENGKGILKKINSVFDVFSSRKSLRYSQTIRLYEAYKDNISQDNLEIVRKIIDYKRTIKNTISLFFERDLNCGIPSVDIVNKLAILFRCY